MRHAISLLFVLLPGSDLTARESDVHIACEVLDPEFHADLDLLVYQHKKVESSQTTQQALVQWVDKAGGDLLNEPGVIAEDLAPYVESLAGPKFANGFDVANDRPEIFIAYSRSVEQAPDFLRSVGFLRYARSACTYGVESPRACFTQSGQIPVSPTHRAKRVVVYTTEEIGITLSRIEPAQAIYHFESDNGTNQLRWSALKVWLAGVSGMEVRLLNADRGQWGRLQEYRTLLEVPGRELWIPTVQEDLAGFKQVKLVNANNPSIVQTVTDGPLSKFAPYLFFDPVLRTNMIVSRTTLGQHDPSSSNLQVWYEHPWGSRNWEPYMKVAPDDLGEEDRPFLLSPEAFVVDGRAYIAFSSANAVEVFDQFDGNIWIASVSAGPVSAVRVNRRPAGAAVRVRLEPELYFPASGPVVFYSQLAHPGDPPEDPDYPCQVYGGGEFTVRNFALRRANVVLPP